MTRQSDNVGKISALWYTGISLGLSLLFLAVTAGNPKYTVVARYGGATWIFLLSLIITMPLVTSYVKKTRNH